MPPDCHSWAIFPIFPSCRLDAVERDGFSQSSKVGIESKPYVGRHRGIPSRTLLASVCRERHWASRWRCRAVPSPLLACGIVWKPETRVWSDLPVLSAQDCHEHSPSGRGTSKVGFKKYRIWFPGVQKNEKNVSTLQPSLSCQPLQTRAHAQFCWVSWGTHEHLLTHFSCSSSNPLL